MNIGRPAVVAWILLAGACGPEQPQVSLKLTTRQLNEPGRMLSAVSARDSGMIAYDFIRQQADRLEVEPEALDQARVTHRFRVPSTGTTHIYMQQVIDGLPIEGATLDIHLSARGQVMNASSRFLPDRSIRPAPDPQPDIQADQALAVVAKRMGLNHRLDPQAADLRAGLRYLPVPAGGLRLIWQLTFSEPVSGMQYQAQVDAHDQTLLQLLDMLGRYDSWTYNAYGLGTFDPQDPTPGWGRHTDPHDPSIHPNGWHLDPDANNLSGRFTEMKRWTWGENPVHLSGSGYDNQLVWDPDPDDTVEAAAVNAFYLVNRGLEIAYHHGFTDQAGNFDRTSSDPDRILGRIQTGFGSPGCGRTVDGVSASLHLPAQTAEGNQHQAGLINELILHEIFGHCIGARILGGKEVVWVGDEALSREEALGDWFGLALSRQPDDSAHEPRRITDYYMEGTGDQECRKRPYPYMVDNPADLHFGRFDHPPAHYCGFKPTHFNGMILAAALWDLTWLLPDTDTALELVFETMRSLAHTDSFLDFRDQLLTVDTALHQGAQHPAIWQAFRRRGMGYRACDPHYQRQTCQTYTAAFDPPPAQNGTIRPWLMAAHDDSRVHNNRPWRYAVGYHFETDRPRILSGLCAYSRSTRKLKLFQYGSPEPLAEILVPTQLWTWACQTLPQPVPLEPGVVYTVAAYHDQTFGGAIQEGGFSFPLIRDGVTIHASTYRFLTSDDQVPTNWISGDVMYGLVDVELGT